MRTFSDDVDGAASEAESAKDLFSAFRYFRHDRWSFAVAVVMLALGIGASPPVFSVAETLASARSYRQ